ncbi:MAG: zinc-ribbon domain-containing protein [Bacillota bacterium]|nr:zinc-ribbon domain-containing protein [Bacillota bacterium]
MAFFDKVSELAAQATQKTESLVENGKTNLEIGKYKRQAKELAARIGFTVYGQYERGEAVPEDVTELCGQIRELEETIEKLQAELAPRVTPEAAQRGTGEAVAENFCPDCGGQVGPGMKFCPHCGRPQ